jgi:endoglucanase
VLVKALSLGLLLVACGSAEGGVSVDEPKSRVNEPVPEFPDPGADHDLLQSGTFDQNVMAPWMSSFTDPGAGKARIQDGALCIDVQRGGENSWDAQLRHRELTLEKGHKYLVRFVARANKPTKVRPKVVQTGPPYTEYWASTIEVGPSPKTYLGRFIMRDEEDPNAELAIHMGGSFGKGAPFEVCIDDVRLADPDYQPGWRAATAGLPKIRANQVGYLPKSKKRAVISNPSAEALDFQLLDAKGTAVFKGKTQVIGEDGGSRDHVHLADFSAHVTPGKGFVLAVGADKSAPFDIEAEVYRGLVSDSMAYFYHNRCGVPIEMPYAGDPKWTRPAGHVGDKNIQCAKGACNYSLDVSGGWYDAGDHGKYVVNAGISVWTLMNAFERSSASFTDGKLKIPESKNGAPDLLDEVRFELEWMLKMQVPAGKPLAGMAHHKVHDEKWSDIPTAPHEDKLPRFLKAPTTAATLNLAASMAQAARVYAKVDPAFATRCKAAAEKAWAAAVANPKRLASGADNTGGGAYEDQEVTDEFYWAAAELFITTGNPEYEKRITGSPYVKRFPRAPDVQSSMTWQSTAALGSISLALVPNKLDPKTIADLKKQIIGAADSYLAITEREGYRVPLDTRRGKLPWGSSSVVLNNLVVMGIAYTFTKADKYENGVVDGMDYLLGRNPLAQSYVSGYGERPLKNPHHRFWAYQKNQKFPPPPPGAVAGGPNTGLDDPTVKKQRKGCAPLTCFIDDIESWSTNEVAINWNAPLVWAVAFLDEEGGR